MQRTLPTLLAILACTSTVQAVELRILPAQIELSNPKANQQLIVVQEENGKITGDFTKAAKLTSSNQAVAIIDEEAVVQPVGNGEATITATVGKATATAKVKVSKTDAPFTWNFRNHVMPLLTKVGCNSGACHGALAGKGGFKLSLRGYAPEDDYFVLTRQARGRRVNRLEPAHSLLLLKPTLALPHGGGQKLEVPSPDYNLLAEWIAAGAPGPSADDAHIERLETFPSEAVLKPKDVLQVLVRAWYSDGTSADVTRWCKFNSTADLIASVDEDGVATVAGYGEAVITVVYANLVATTRIASPYPNKLDAAVFAKAPRANFVDELVLKKLQALRIPPSPTCTDSEFIRRAYLDAAGILPTPDEVKAFVTNPAPDKRGQLIDALLQRPEFVDYWAYKWSDLLLISSRKLPEPAMRAFYQFVRQSVADDKPWNQFARDILTAQGSNLQNGAANYFLLHTDVTELNETTSLTFLGMSLTCARCHNHPLEKWTQDQYWGMANLFSRVALKNTDRAGEITVNAQPMGDVLHPRRGVAMLPTPLDGKPLDLRDATDRRQYFAAWLTSPENPYFAKAVVNRVWRNFMGRGLVEAEDDLRQTNPPSNAELLDAVAQDFVKHGYDMKHLMSVIMNSATYQRSSVPLDENRGDDRFYSHYLVRRLPAEVILDAYAQTTGVPTEFKRVRVGSSGGEKDIGDYPPGTRALQLPDTQLVSQFLDAFGRPDREQTCSCERQDESTVAQALQLNNGKTLNDRLRAKECRIEQWLKENITNEHAVERIFLLALSREPTASERQRLLDLLAEAARDPQANRREALEDLYWAVLTGREFLFNR